MTVTPGSTAPLASVTVPRIPPRKSWADADAALSASAAHKAARMRTIVSLHAIVAQLDRPLQAVAYDRKSHMSPFCQEDLMGGIIRGHEDADGGLWIDHLPRGRATGQRSGPDVPVGRRVRPGRPRRNRRTNDRRDL